MDLYKPVYYLENSDFSENGNDLINPKIPKNKPVVIMLAANFCGHCTTAKPAYQSAAENHPEIFFATVQGDSQNPEEQKLSQRLSQMFPGFSGYPTFVGYSNGKFARIHDGGRDEESIVAFAKSL